MISWILGGLAAGVAFLAVHDITQKKHTITRNFPVVGHLRYLIERIGPELRQYIVARNDEERPFNRDQRTWVYASAKKENNYFGFGTDNDLEHVPGYVIVKHATFPAPPSHYGDNDSLPCAKVMGAARGRAHAFRPASIVNVSAMSYGSLSRAAVESINKGCKLAHALHNTGEGGIAPHHDHGGGLIFQIGTGYFGCRTPDGGFDMAMLKDRVARFDVRAIEIKLSQGAKPGKGGVLPGSKVTPEIAGIRGVPVGQTVLSPAAHTAFSDADSLLDFIEGIAQETGLPVGIKSAVGHVSFFEDLAALMEDGQRGVDFIQVDGGEGGTGAAPLVFSDHVSLPFLVGFPRVYRAFAERGLTDKVVFIGSGKLGIPDRAALGLALGCDMISVAREAMLAIGCIQAQKCHTGHCPTGIATHESWLVRGLDPTLKSVRLANYLATLRHDLLDLAAATGTSHPAEISLDDLELLDGRLHGQSAREAFGYPAGWGVPGTEVLEAVRALRTH